MDEFLSRLDLENPRDAIDKISSRFGACGGDPVFGLQVSENVLEISECIYLIVNKVLRGSPKLNSAVSLLRDLSKLVPGGSSLLTDVLATVDIETSCAATENNAKSERDTFLQLLSDLQADLNEADLAERLDLDTLEHLGQIKSTELFNKRYIKTRTKLYYKQQKFNLLREENEGYAKLLTELNQDLNNWLTPKQFVSNMKSLIGKFNLDPNRVVDVMLEVVECQPDLEYFVAESFSEMGIESSQISQTLGFKFRQFKGGINQTLETPASLLYLLGLLFGNGVIAIDDVYPHLSPPDKEMLDVHKKYVINCRQAARKMTAVVLSEKIAEDNVKELESLRTPPEVGDNQKLGLVEQLLNMGDWEHAKAVIDRLPPNYANNFGNVNHYTCRLLHYIIEPLFKTVYKNSGAALPTPTMSFEFKSRFVPPQVTEFSGLTGAACELVVSLGPSLSADPILYVKLIRLCQEFLKTYSDKPEKTPAQMEVYRTILTMLDVALLPSLALMGATCYYSELLWSVLQHLPYQDRYHLYYLWKTQAYSVDPQMIIRKAEVTDKIKYFMKRLSKDTIKSMGRHIAKLAFSNPLITFDHVIEQLQKYDNLNAPMADVLKMFSQLSIDALIYTLVEGLSDTNKSKINQANASLSPWLNSLATFTGLICKKYTFDTSGLLQYIANQLKANSNFDLVVLKELLSKMTGVTVFEDVTNDELFALGGGELLRSEAAFQGQVRQCQKSARRLKDVMVDQNVSFPLCMLLANHRNSIVFEEGIEGHLKLIGSLYDQSQDCFVQMTEFLELNLTLEEMSSLPVFDKLLSEFGLSPDAAFTLSRMKFQRQINLKFEELKQEERSKVEDGKLTDKVIVKKYKEAVDSVMEPVQTASVPVLRAQNILFDHVSDQFYFTFWSLSLYDIRVPVDVYEKERNRLETQVSAVDSKNEWSESRKNKEREKVKSMIEKLKEEQQKQLEHVTRVMFRLKSESKNWFPSKTAKSDCIMRLQQFCLFQRCLFSASDAIFCALFIKIIHSLSTVNFSTILCFDRVFSELIYSVASFTENEASRYGRFLYAMWEIILKWHSDKEVYTKECASYPGFYMTIRKDANSTKTETILEYENFRHVCYKWQFKVARDLIQCLESKDYIQTRNTLILLTRMLPFFPKVTHLGEAIVRRIEKVQADEKNNRPDLSSLAMGYLVKLKTHKSKLINEEVFHDKKDETTKKEKIKAHEAQLSRARAAAAANAKRASKESSREPTPSGANAGSKLVNGAAAAAAASANHAAPPTTGVKRSESAGTKSPDKRSASKESSASSDPKKRRLEKNDDAPSKTPHTADDSSKKKKVDRKVKEEAVPSSDDDAGKKSSKKRAKDT